MKAFINFPRVEGNASRQAHADLPEGTFEREMSKEGFFGPSALLHHKRPPTGWVDWSGPLRPRAFDLNKLPAPGAGTIFFIINIVEFLFGARAAKWTISSETETETSCYLFTEATENFSVTSGD